MIKYFKTIQNKNRISNRCNILKVSKIKRMQYNNMKLILSIAYKHQIMRTRTFKMNLKGKRL